MALITAGLVRLYIIHGLKIMLALLGLRPDRLIQKKKKEKKESHFNKRQMERLSRFLEKKCC
jgi:hypothetical protein